MKLYNKTSLKTAMVFGAIYTLVLIFGAPFLVSWGSTGIFHFIIDPFLSFPVDWPSLIAEKSFLFFVLNILFWSAIVYLLTLIGINIYTRRRKIQE